MVDPLVDVIQFSSTRKDREDKAETEEEGKKKIGSFNQMSKPAHMLAQPAAYV